MWLFAIYWSPTWTAVLGAIWIVVRVIYFLGHQAAPDTKYPGFFIQSLAITVLVLGALGRIIHLMASGG